MSSNSLDIPKIVESVTEFRNAYVGLKLQNVAQEKIIQAQIEHINKMRNIMNKLYEFISEEKKNEILQKLKVREDGLLDQNKYLSETMTDLQQECQNYFIKNQELQERININQMQISELEKELEILKSQIAIQQDNHEAQLKALEESYKQELLKKEEEISTLKEVLESKRGENDNTYLWKVALNNLKGKGTKRSNNFRFPDLSEFLEKTYKTSKCRKKRKLFITDSEEMMDLSPNHKED